MVHKIHHLRVQLSGLGGICNVVQPSPLIPEYFHHPLTVTPVLPSPTPWQLLICFLSLWIFLFWAFHVNEII